MCDPSGKPYTCFLDDVLRGRLCVVEMSDAPIPWPISYSGRKRVPIVASLLLLAPPAAPPAFIRTFAARS
jgi:hypothetical protein